MILRLSLAFIWKSIKNIINESKSKMQPKIIKSNTGLQLGFNWIHQTTYNNLQTFISLGKNESSINQ